MIPVRGLFTFSNLIALRLFDLLPLWYNSNIERGGARLYLDLYCPIELLSFELLRDDTGKVRAYLTLNNLSNVHAVSIEGTVHWIDTKSDHRTDTAFTADQFKPGKQKPFKLQLATADNPNTDEIELTIHRVQFDRDKPDWIGKPEDRLRIEGPLIPRGSELNKLLQAAGYDAAHFPLRTKSYWICICGRPNPIGDSNCARCNRKQTLVFSKYTRAKVLSGETEPQHTQKLKLDVPDYAKPSPRELAEQGLELLAEQYKEQRNILIRRSLFLLIAAIIAFLLWQASSWLGEKRDLAKQMHRPVKVEATTAPEDH